MPQMKTLEGEVYWNIVPKSMHNIVSEEVKTVLLEETEGSPTHLPPAVRARSNWDVDSLSPSLDPSFLNTNNRRPVQTHDCSL